jgi:hypothetical protein
VGDDGEDDIYTKGSGSVFVVTGTAGAKLDDKNPDDLEAGYFAKWMVANSDPRTGFTKFTVSNTDISAEFVGSTSTSNFTDEFAVRTPGTR